MNNFYHLSHNSFSTRGVPWMRGVRSVFKTRICPHCGIASEKPQGVILLEPETHKGSFWPDVLGEGSGTISTCFSEKVKLDWENAGFKYGKAWEVKIMEPYPKKLVDIKPPKFFWIEAPVGIKINYEDSGMELVSECPSCGYQNWTMKPGQVKTYLYPETWTGLDIFRFSQSALTTFCTQRVLDLAIEKRWTNFWFSPINTPPPSQPIPYLKLSKSNTL